MDSFRVFSFYLCFWIVHTAIIEDLTINKRDGICGTVTIKGPNVRGRDFNVTFLPTPVKPGSSAKVYRAHKNPSYDEMVEYGTSYTYTLKRNTYSDLSNSYVRYRISQSQYCDSSFFRGITWMGITGCGLLYMYKRGPIMFGDTVELRYMPADAILKLPNNYVRKWIFRNDNQTQAIKIDNSIITEEQAYFNNETVLTLRNITMAMSGVISLQCTENRTENKITDEIKIQVIEKPTFIEPPSATFSDCVNCLFGYYNENNTFTCAVHGSTESLRVFMSIGAKNLEAHQTRHAAYTVNVDLQEDAHLQNVNCSVTVSTHYPVILSKRIYVIRPSTPDLDFPRELFQDRKENFTCRILYCRPPPKITFMIHDYELHDVQQYNLPTGRDLYSIEGTLNSGKQRHWNKSNMTCCASYLNRRHCSNLKHISYKFGPEKVSMQIDSREVNSTLRTYNMVCSVYNFSAQCDINIYGVLSLNVSIKREESGHSSTIHHRFSISVGSEDQVRTVDCVVTCQSLNQTHTKSYQLPEEASTSTVGNDGHGALIGAVVSVFAVAVIMIVIGCVYRKRKKQRHEQNAVSVHRNDDAPTHPELINDRPADGGVIIQCSTTNPENEYASVIPKSQRPQRQQAETIPLAAENDCEYAVVNKERKGRTNSSVHTQLATSEPELNYAELDIHTPLDQYDHATVSSATSATEYTSIDFSRTYNNALTELHDKNKHENLTLESNHLLSKKDATEAE